MSMKLLVKQCKYRLSIKDTNTEKMERSESCSPADQTTHQESRTHLQRTGYETQSTWAAKHARSS